MFEYYIFVYFIYIYIYISGGYLNFKSDLPEASQKILFQVKIAYKPNILLQLTKSLKM